MKKRLMIALCCLVLLVNLLPIVPMAETVAAGEIPQTLYYCREQLKTMNNSEALLFAYDNIVAGIDACAEEIVISNNQYKISPDEFEMVLEATRRDHTEQFWMGTTYTPYTNLDETVLTKFLPTYSMSGDELQDAKVAFEQATAFFLSNITPEMSEYEKEKTLHDMLATHITYVSSDNAHNAYGALVEGKAVCEGYAEALQYLLQRVGIQSVEIFGYGINPTTGVGEPHAWNAVRIDGQFYLVDLTWNDQESLLSYAYFNQTSAVLGEDHEQWRIGHKIDGSELSCQVFNLPVCTATEANYYNQNSAFKISTYTVASISKLLKENNMSVSVYVVGDPLVFESWYNTNYVDIAKALGITGSFSYGTIVIGHEVRIILSTCMHSNVRRVEAKDATCTEDGNMEYYVCKSGKCGKWFSDAEALHEIFNHDSVKIFAIGHDWSVKDIENENTFVSKATNCQEHDTYWYICATCGEMSDTYTFTTVAGAHVDANEDGVCDLCRDGEKPSILDNIIHNVIGGDVSGEGGELLTTILSNPYILGGGGGAILLVVIIVIINRVRG